MEIRDTRVAMLRRLVEEAGSIAALSRRHEAVDATYVSQLLNGHRAFGEKAARNMERRLGLEPGSLDRGFEGETEVALRLATTLGPAEGYVRLEHLSPEPSMGHGTSLSEPEHVVEFLDVLESWVREKVGSANPSRIKILTGSGNSMAPLIGDGDLIFVDTTCHSIETEGIYVLDVVGRLLLKKALILSDGTLILRSENVAEYPNEERHDLRRAAETIVVCGRVLAWWTLRRG